MILKYGVRLMRQGLFITFEGIDGCGKSLMAAMTQTWLVENGYEVLATLEPGGSDLGKVFRQMLLDSSYGSVDSHTETLLFMVDRSRHVTDVIRPALANGKIVLCDRYIDSTIAYQGGGRGLDIDELTRLNDFAINGVYPDLTIYLSLPIEQAMQRIPGTKDRLEQENVEFFARVAAEYEQLADQYPHRIQRIDASGSPQDVFALVQTAIGTLFKDRGRIYHG